MATVQMSVDDPAEYLRTKCKDGNRFASVAEVDPFYVSLDVLERNSYVGAIDWRSDADELVAALNPLLERCGIRNFDWSFIDEFEAAENWEALENQNLLATVGQKIAERNHVFMSFGIGWDNYNFAVMKPHKFSKVNGLRGRDFEIGRFYEGP